MTFQHIFPCMIYEPGYHELAVAILQRAVVDLRNPCARQDALDWFERGDCCWILDGIGIDFDYMMRRVDDVMAMPLLDNRRPGKRKPVDRERWKRVRKKTPV